MPSINFNTGLVQYSINGVCEVSFNPTDSFFVESLFTTFDELDKKQDWYKTQIEKIADKREIFAFARERDKEMRVMIDNVFQAPVSDAIFGSLNVYALADGLPIWANLLLSIMDEIDTGFAREQKAMNPRVQKYLAKYNKYQKT